MDKTKLETLEELSLVNKIRIGILVILHVVGIIGFSIPAYAPLFQMITPFHLIIISFVLLYDRVVLSRKFALFFGLAFTIGFWAEVIGVKTGLLFGYYQYSDVLGFKFFDVPIALGLLWAASAYAANEIANHLLKGVVLKVIVAALFLVLFDFLLEPFAIHAGLWQWNSSKIPNYNYVSWFIVGSILSIIYQNLIKTKFNVISIYFLLIQMIFFLAYQLVNGLIAFN